MLVELIRETLEYLRHHSDPILADAQDCDYFRKKHQKTTKPSASPSRAPATPLRQQDPEASPPTEALQGEKPSLSKLQPEIKKTPIPEPIAKPLAELEIAALPTAPKETSPTLPPIETLKRKPSEFTKPVEEKRYSPTPSSVSPQNLPEEKPESKIEVPLFSFPRWKTLMAKIAPELHVASSIPNDATAKKIATRWKTKNQTAPITILCYQEMPDQKALLERVAVALDVHFGPARMISAESIEKEKQWEAFLSVPDLRLVIVCDYTLWQLPSLLQFYKEIPALKMRQLGSKPLLLLPDLSLYLKDPLLKRSLWKALCQTCDPALQPSSSTKT